MKKKKTQQLAIPRTIQIAVREICFLQQRFTYRRGAQPHRLLENPRFRAAYDLLLLRAKAEEPIQELAKWWTEFYSAIPEHREKMLKQVQPSPSSRKRYYRRFKNKIRRNQHENI